MNDIIHITVSDREGEVVTRSVCLTDGVLPQEIEILLEDMVETLLKYKITY